jgi:hypothetical protein
MKLTSYTVFALLLPALVVGCQSHRSDRVARSQMDNESSMRRNMQATERRAMMPEETVTSRTSDDIAIASAVKRRLSQDLTINTKGMSVSADHGTVYLTGTADSMEEKTQAEQHALEVAGVSSVVNRLQVQSAAVPSDTRSARMGTSGSCTLAAVIPAARTETSFATIEVRVFDDITSPLYHGSKDLPPDVSETTPRVSVMQGMDTPSGAGPTGGVMQDVGSAQQGGTLEQTHRESVTEDMRSSDRPRVTDERRIRTSNDPKEARLSDRRGNLIWNGWLKNGEKKQLPSAGGPVRYDYRYTADERFHGNKGAWCKEGQRIVVP